MNEAQVWTVIGLMASMVATMMTVVSTSFVHTMRAEFKMVRLEMASEFKGVRTDIAAIDHDVQVLYRRAFGGDSE